MGRIKDILIGLLIGMGIVAVWITGIALSLALPVAAIIYIFRG